MRFHGFEYWIRRGRLALIRAWLDLVYVVLLAAIYGCGWMMGDSRQQTTAKIERRLGGPLRRIW